MKSSWSDCSKSHIINIYRNNRDLIDCVVYCPEYGDCIHSYGECFLMDGNYNIREYFGQSDYVIHDGWNIYYVDNKQIHMYINYVYMRIKNEIMKIYLFKLKSEIKKIINNYDLFKTLKIIIIGDKNLQKYVINIIKNFDSSSQYLSCHYEIFNNDILLEINFHNMAKIMLIEDHLSTTNTIRVLKNFLLTNNFVMHRILFLKNMFFDKKIGVFLISACNYVKINKMGRLYYYRITNHRDLNIYVYHNFDYCVKNGFNVNDLEYNYYKLNLTIN